MSGGEETSGAARRLQQDPLDRSRPWPFPQGLALRRGPGALLSGVCPRSGRTAESSLEPLEFGQPLLEEAHVLGAPRAQR